MTAGRDCPHSHHSHLLLHLKYMVMGYLGNKGSVAVSMSIEGTSFCFVAAHLASGEKKGDEGRRNHQVAEIFRRTSFSRTTKDHHHFPLTILGHE